MVSRCLRFKGLPFPFSADKSLSQVRKEGPPEGNFAGQQQFARTLTVACYSKAWAVDGMIRSISLV